MFTLKSSLRDLYKHPLGYDVICKILLQAGLSRRLIFNPLMGNISLGLLNNLAGKKLGGEFFKALLTLLNQSPDTLEHDSQERDASRDTAPAWWKEAVFYQIYPRSFMDGNGDGIGDLPGILSRLDYLKTLGVDALWLSPIYDSPGDDNGYDIRDYHKIDAQFGTMEDFDTLLKGVHARGMRLVMDLVVNHTSDEHPWFKDALSSPASTCRNYYFLYDKPNNWTSFFSGSAWNEYPEQKLWGLHLFSKKQMDLNWDNPQLRQDVYGMIRWWLEKGVDGFRLDVINYISKARAADQTLPDGDGFIGKLMGFTGIEHYFYGPNLHRYLQEMQQEAFAPYQAFSVGETPGIGMKTGKLLTDESRRELDMIFSFDHLETSGHVRFDQYEYDLNYYKAYIIDWMEHYADTSWMALFFDNHDNPRMVSKVDHSHQYRQEVAKMLAIVQLTLKGTPFLFQGQELGMINKDYKDIRDFRDVESLNKYRELSAAMPEEEAFRHILAGSRDHARAPMQWTSAPGGGFSTAAPWIESDGDELYCNAEAQSAEPGSVLSFYREMIGIRKKYEALVYGDIQFFHRKKKDILSYSRSLNGETYWIICNLSRHEKNGPQGLPGQGSAGNQKQELLLGNYPETAGKPNPSGRLRAYEGKIYRILPLAHSGQWQGPSP